MPSDLFFSYAERIGAYSGALRARVQIQGRSNPQSTATAPTPTPTPQRAAASRYGPHDRIEYSDDGTKILNGVAVDENDVPLWVKRRSAGKKFSEGVSVIPGDYASIAFSPAFAGQFSYARVSKQEVSAGDQR